MNAGYYRNPTLANEQIVFICENDLWTVESSGGVARRLTSNLGSIWSAAISPDGQYIAFVSYDEGSFDVYIMPSQGGEAKRITFWGGYTHVVGWWQERIVVRSNAKAMAREDKLYALSHDGLEVEELPTGNAVSVAFSHDGRMLIARHTSDIARWKRYRGGRTGVFWIQDDHHAWHELIRGDGKGLLPIAGNVASPMWLGERIYFISDHEGVGNLYSCTAGGEDIQRHTHYEDFYARHAFSDGTHVVYHAGADIYCWNAEDGGRKIDIALHSPRVDTKRKFVDAEEYLESYSLHPDGSQLLLSTRGSVFSFKNFEGAVRSHSYETHVRYRLPVWLQDGVSFLLVSDSSGEDRFELHKFQTDTQAPSVQRFEDVDSGRLRGIAVSPVDNCIAFGNHRNQLCMFNTEDGVFRVLDTSEYGAIYDMVFSPDGKWLAYGKNISAAIRVIMLCELATNETHMVTCPTGWDMMPDFDPDGRFLYFISYRVFNPVWDSLHFELSFPRGSRPYLITLQADTPSPFEHYEAVDASKLKKKQVNDKGKTDENRHDDSKTVTQIQIDLENIQSRTVAFPVVESIYNKIIGLKDKVMYSHSPVQGTLYRNRSAKPSAKNKLECYDFSEKEAETLISGMSNFSVSLERKHLIYNRGHQLRVIKAGEKPKHTTGKARKTGWIDLKRIKISIDPKAEWQQLLGEAWRLQRDLFWTEDMSGVDWQGVYARYAPLLSRVSSRSEVNDVIQEMQGELGTSHAYVRGGDFAPEPNYPLGLLGAELRYVAAHDGYEIVEILQGDPWNTRESSPLARAGSRVKVGDVILAVNGQRVGREVSVQSLLVNQAGNEISLTIQPDQGDSFDCTITPLRSEAPLRYREWVNKNRQRVHQETDGRLGYIHIPDMSPLGYAEFHHAWLLEQEREGLVIDVRFNGGGNVSSLLLEKLARKPLAHIEYRYAKANIYPHDSTASAMVAITNEAAGSDGDIFSHAWKMLDLGPLIGKRTWGGVIGIHSRDRLIDGGVTTQPLASFHFHDVGYQVENYGTDPTIEVDIRPEDYVAGRDPQLERAIGECLKILEAHPRHYPDLESKPNLAPPTLPKLPKLSKLEDES